MRHLGHFRFSVRGFSAKRMAFGVVFISAALLPFHSVSDYRGDEYLTLTALGFTGVALLLGFQTSRTDRKRFMPFAVGLIVSVMHFFFCKL
jgi:hypothetical protein